MTKIVFTSPSADLSFGFSIPLKRMERAARVPHSSSNMNWAHCIYSVLPVVPQEVTAFVPTKKDHQRQIFLPL